MPAVKIAICGAAGRMGSAIRGLALRDKQLVVGGLVESKGNPIVGRDLDGVRVTDDIAAALKGTDVVIDFTSPDSAVKNAAAAAAAKKALVVGTTGIDGSLRQKFLASVSRIPVVVSPNMSLSANVMFDLAERVARLLPDYDAEIVEAHHNLKKDAPSGTAFRLAESVKKGRGKGDFIHGRQGQVGARRSSEIGVHAVRGGDVVGDHTVFFFGDGERIELIHRVTSRNAFAHGALLAAKWVAGRKAGLYDMGDVLGLK